MTILREGVNRMADRLNRFAKVNKAGGASAISVPANSVKWRPEEAGSFELSIVPYIITKPNHPDGSLLGEEFTVGDDWYRRPYGVHHNIGGKSMIVCPKATFNLPCPICERKWELGKNYEQNKEEMKLLKVQKMTMYNVYVKEGFKIFDWQESKFGEMLEKEVSQAEDKSIAGFSLLKGGKSIRIRVIKDSFMGKDFFKCDRIDFKDRADLDDSILEKAPRLDDCVKCMSYDELKALMEGPVTKQQHSEPPEVEAEEEAIPVKAAPKPVVIEQDEEPVVVKPPPMNKILKAKESLNMKKEEVSLIDEDWN